MNHYQLNAFVKKIKMKSFKDLVFNPHPNHMGGVQSIYNFENGYGVSVVRTPHTYGGSDGLYELAVLDKNGHLTYDTPITDDVIGYLKAEEVTKIMQQVQMLK
jgi:hypothetical protein